MCGGKIGHKQQRICVSQMVVFGSSGCAVMDKGGFMRAFSKVMETLGITLLFLGIASMDNPTMIGTVMLFGGLGILFGGASIEEAL